MIRGAGRLLSPTWCIYLRRALELVQAGDDAKDVVFVDVDFQTGKCFLEGLELGEQAFAFDHYAIIQESIKRIQGRLDWNPTFLYLLEEEFTVYEGTELVNLINPGRPIVSNNFLVKYGEYVEEVGLKRVPKKKPRKNLSIEIKSLGAEIDSPSLGFLVSVLSSFNKSDDWLSLRIEEIKFVSKVNSAIVSMTY